MEMRLNISTLVGGIALSGTDAPNKLLCSHGVKKPVKTLFQFTSTKPLKRYGGWYD